jgi:hypothetical protein
MSHGKFAPVTANLLVRKGEAAPSAVAVPPQPLRPVAWIGGLSSPPMADAEHKFVFSPEHGEHGHGADAKEHCGAGEKPRRIVLALTPHEYETLGLVAVKKGSTRHQLAQEAMDAYFEWLISEYGEACSCIVGGALCRCECGARWGGAT